jgi:hypothetical protein
MTPEALRRKAQIRPVLAALGSQYQLAPYNGETLRRPAVKRYESSSRYGVAIIWLQPVVGSSAVLHGHPTAGITPPSLARGVRRNARHQIVGDNLR